MSHKPIQLQGPKPSLKTSNESIDGSAQAQEEKKIRIEENQEKFGFKSWGG